MECLTESTAQVLYYSFTAISCALGWLGGVLCGWFAVV